MDLNDEAFNDLIDELRDTCENYEDDLELWEIEDALTTIRREYQ